MSFSGTGFGGVSAGGSPVPLQRDIETTAWTEVNKAQLGIIPDSLDVSLAQIAPRYSPSYLGTDTGYKSSADQPLLGHPLDSVRVLQLFNKPTDNAWEAQYNDLIDDLPPDLNEQFVQQMNLPFEDRNPNFVAFDNFLKGTAKVLVNINALSSTPDPDSVEGTHAAINLIAPMIGFKEGINQGGEVLGSALDFVQNQGPNYRYYDDFVDALTQFQGILTTMNSMDVRSLFNEGFDGSNSPLKEQIGKVNSNINTILQGLENRSTGTDLQILASTLRSLSTLTASLSLPNNGSAALFLGLSVALMKSDQSNAQSEVINPALKNLLNTLSDSVSGGNPSQSQFLRLLVEASFILAGVAATHIAHGSLGPLPDLDRSDQRAGQSFSAELALTLANSSGVLPGIYKSFLDSANANSGGGNETS